MSLPGPRPLVLLAALLAVLLSIAGPLAGFELQAYDARLRLRSPGRWPEDLVAIEIDDRTQRAHGGMPWPREKTAALLSGLRAAGARTIAVDLAFGFPRDAAGDEALAAALDRVLLAIPPASGNSGATNDDLRAALVPGVGGRSLPADRLVPPIREFAARASGVGHAVLERDRDGQYRRFLPAITVESLDGALPSLALRALLQHRGLLPDDVLRSDAIALPHREPVGRATAAGAFLLDFVPGEAGPPTVSAADVLDGRAGSLEGKLALLYVAASASTDRWPTPIRAETPGGLIHAYAIRTLDTGRAPREVAPTLIFLPLLAASLLAAEMLAARRPTTVLATAVAAASGYVALTLVLVPWKDLFLPAVLPGTHVALASLAILLHASRRTEIERARLAARLAGAPGSGDASDAPTGEIALVFTDVEGSTRLWERRSRAMSEALTLTSTLFRATLVREGGYEVKTEGDAFMIAFRDPLSAVQWCLSVQEALVAAPWPDALLTAPEAEGRDGFRGLRVRMGVHVGIPAPRPDPLTGRMDYFGPMVNRAARVSSAAHGGQVIVSGAVFERIALALEQLGSPVATDLGSHWLKGLDTAERLVQLVPRALAARRFAPPKSERVT